MHTHRPSIIGPLIIITIGVLLLLANLGYLPLTFWEQAARYWPLILILIGLEIIFGRRSFLAALAIIALWVALVAGIVWLSFTPSGALIGSAATTTDAVSQPLGDVKSAEIKLNLGLSLTTIKALTAESSDLVSGTFTHSPDLKIVKTYNVSGNAGLLSLREEGNVFVGNPKSQLDLALTSRVPLRLTVNGGVGRGVFDLTELNVTAMDFDAGVGSIQVTAPKTGVMTLRVNGGVGSLAVIIPQGVAARIRVNTGLGGTSVDPSRFPKVGDVYQSADYASATNRIDVDVNGGVGSISVR